MLWRGVGGSERGRGCGRGVEGCGEVVGEECEEVVRE